MYVKLYTLWIYIQNLHFPNINPLHSDPFALPATPSHVFYSQFLTTPQLSPPENHRTKCFYVIFYTRHMYVHISTTWMHVFENFCTFPCLFCCQTKTIRLDYTLFVFPWFESGRRPLGRKAKFSFLFGYYNNNVAA